VATFNEVAEVARLQALSGEGKGIVGQASIGVSLD
jgi:hypothetical protein